MTEVVPIKQEVEHNFRFYCQPNNMAKIIGNRMLIFGSWALIGYVGQFILIVSVLNVYSDIDRFLPCGIAGVDTADLTGQAAVYD